MCYNADDMREITTTQSSFQDFIELDALYVDKTMYAYSLVRDPRRNFFFISRPRRYGKSLFCSTLHALFDGRRDLFKGLYIAERTDYSFERFPVLHFDLSPLDTLDMESFLASFRLMLRIQADNNGIAIADGSPAAMLTELIDELVKKEGKRIIIIIDEFDSPMTGAMDKEFIGSIRDVFSAFYAVIKMNAPRIRFLFITGVVKLSNLSIFSRMNNLIDLSMNPHFAAAFGYTDDELMEHFGDGMDEYCETHPDEYASRNEFASRIREYYDGYRFSPDSDVTVYNPVSIGYFFNEECRFRSYWDMTGVSTLAVTLASRIPLAEVIEDTGIVSISAFTSFDISQIYSGRLLKNSILALLYYTGYLTIKDGNEDGITLAFPNTEISSSFTSSLAGKYGEDEDEAINVVVAGKMAARKGDTQALIRKLSDFYAQCSSQILSHRFEQPYQLIAHMFFIAAGCRAATEEGTMLGRIDNSMRVGRHIYLLELKVDESADNALSQIRDRRYDEKFRIELERDYTIHLIGVSFSSEKRNISEYKEEIIRQ